MENTLLADILKAHDTLNTIEFTINDNKYKFYFRHLTILEHTRIKLACIKTNTFIRDDGSKETKQEEDEHLYPIYTILEKALDENGKKLYSITNRDDFAMFSKMQFALLSQIAAEMSFDVTGNIASILKSE